MNNEVPTRAFVKLFNHLHISLSLFPAGRQDPVPVLAVGPGPGGVRGAAAGAGGEAGLLCRVPHHHHLHPGATGEDEAAGGEAEDGQRDHLQTRRGLRIMYLHHEQSSDHHHYHHKQVVNIIKLLMTHFEHNKEIKTI